MSWDGPNGSNQRVKLKPTGVQALRIQTLLVACCLHIHLCHVNSVKGFSYKCRSMEGMRSEPVSSAVGTANGVPRLRPLRLQRLLKDGIHPKRVNFRTDFQACLQTCLGTRPWIAAPKLKPLQVWPLGMGFSLPHAWRVAGGVQGLPALQLPPWVSPLSKGLAVAYGRLVWPSSVCSFLII